MNIQKRVSYSLQSEKLIDNYFHTLDTHSISFAYSFSFTWQHSSFFSFAWKRSSLSSFTWQTSSISSLTRQPFSLSSLLLLIIALYRSLCRDDCNFSHLHDIASANNNNTTTNNTPTVIKYTVIPPTLSILSWECPIAVKFATVVIRWTDWYKPIS